MSGIIFDEDAIQELAESLDIIPESIRSSVEVGFRYQRLCQRNKQKRQNERRDRVAAQEIEKYRAEHPNECFCGAQHDIDKDEVIRTETRISEYQRGMFGGNGKYEEPIYRCSNCGKEWEMPSPAMA